MGAGKGLTQPLRPAWSWDTAFTQGRGQGAGSHLPRLPRAPPLTSTFSVAPKSRAGRGPADSAQPSAHQQEGCGEASQAGLQSSPSSAQGHAPGLEQDRPPSAPKTRGSTRHLGGPAGLNQESSTHTPRPKVEAIKSIFLERQLRGSHRPKVTRRTGSCQDPQVVRDWVVTPPNCTPGARSPLKAKPKALRDLHQPVTAEGARQTPDAQSGARGPGLRGVGTPERDPRPSTAAPTTLQGSGEYSVLNVMSCKLNTTHPPARLPPAQVPTRPGTSGIYDGSPLLETLGPSQACSGERVGRGGEGGAGPTQQRKGRPHVPVWGHIPGAPPQAPSPGTHRCSFSSGWALAASPGHAWRRGPRGLSDWFPKAPRLLQEKEEMPTGCPHLGLWGLRSSTLRRPPPHGGGPSTPTWGASRRAQNETPNCQRCPSHPMQLA